MRHHAWSVAAACVVVACSQQDDHVPGAPSGPVIARTIDRDAGAVRDSDDAGPSDAGAAVSYCSRVGVVSDSAQIATTIDTPGDFTLMRQVEGWRGDCAAPRLSLQFSDGYCPIGKGHELSFSFGYLELLDGALHTGNNPVSAETDTPAIRIRYTRPSNLSPSGTWGTCEGASGQLVFLEEPVPQPGHYLQARFLVTLTACDGSANDPQLVQGTFKLLLRTSVDDACPNREF